MDLSTTEKVDRRWSFTAEAWAGAQHVDLSITEMVDRWWMITTMIGHVAQP